MQDNYLAQISIQNEYFRAALNASRPGGQQVRGQRGRTQSTVLIPYITNPLGNCPQPLSPPTSPHRNVPLHSLTCPGDSLGRIWKLCASASARPIGICPQSPAAEHGSGPATKPLLGRRKLNWARGMVSQRRGFIIFIFH